MPVKDITMALQMKGYRHFFLALLISFCLFTTAYGAALFKITTTNGAQTLSVGQTATVTYQVQNMTSFNIPYITYSVPFFARLASTTCGSVINSGSICTVNLSVTAPSPPGNYGTVNFEVCGYGGSLCSTNDSNNGIQLTITSTPTLSITPQTAYIPVSTTTQFSVTGASSVTWNSSDTTVATIDTTGLATGLAPGSTQITATAQGATSNQATLNVYTPGPLTLTTATNAKGTFVAGTTYLSLTTGTVLRVPYTVTNTGSSAFSNPTIVAPNNTTVVFNTCGSSIAAGATCTISLSLTAPSVSVAAGVQNLGFLVPLVCNSTLTVCNSPDSANQVQFIARAHFPLPVAMSFYPIYAGGAGPGYLTPTTSMPFNKVSSILISFAHPYPNDGHVYPNQTPCPTGTSPSDAYNGPVTLQFERNQPDEPQNLSAIVSVSKSVNPHIKYLVALGYGAYDWNCIAGDYIFNFNQFPPSVVNFIRSNNLDGFDIDDESLGTGGSANSGYISQANYDAVILNIRMQLDQASIADGKQYYLSTDLAPINDPNSIDGTNVSPANMNNFDLIMPQSYFDHYLSSAWSPGFITEVQNLGYPLNQIVGGINSQTPSPGICNSPILASACVPTPDGGASMWCGGYEPGYAGAFLWTFSFDSVCSPAFLNTSNIASTVGY